MQKYFRPYDLVTEKHSKSVGMITEVNVNRSQSPPTWEYHVEWLIQYPSPYGILKVAWWHYGDLVYQCNIFGKIAKSSAHCATLDMTRESENDAEEILMGNLTPTKLNSHALL